jgi:lipopolysaccharide export system protein LptA
MINTKTLFFTLFTGLLLLAQTASRAAENVEKIFIDADHMQLNLETGYSVYTGNVKIRQGELKLTGDKVTVQQTNNEIQRITVTGKPAHYDHVTEKGENIQAQSEHMVYTASQNKLVMTINAQLTQPGNKVNSQKITYDTKKKIVIAGDKRGETPASGTKAKQRVNIVLTPKKAPATKPATE